MIDYREEGAMTIDDAAADDPPTVDEVMDQQWAEYPDQAATSSLGLNHGGRDGVERTAGDDSTAEAATVEAGGRLIGENEAGEAEIEGPNSV